MITNRRTWVQQMSMGLIGLGLSPLDAIAIPSGRTEKIVSGNNNIRLSSNENVYGPSPNAATAMSEAILLSNRYNWSTTGDLITEIANKNSISQESILLAAGSSEILNILAQFFAFQKGDFVVAHPSFTGWTRSAENLGMKKISVPLTATKQHDLQAMLAAITPETRFVYVCNPNNPTGTICEREELISFIGEASKKTTVILDEAYIDYADQASVSYLTNDNKNLVLVRTFSKIYGLAGSRTGYAIAHKDTIEKISKTQSWANGGVSVVSRAGALASLKDDVFVKQCRLKNEEVKKYTVQQLKALNILCIPSHTNFIYFTLANYQKDFFALLKDNHIEGTYLFEEKDKWTRITIGTLDEMKTFIAAIS